MQVRALMASFAVVTGGLAWSATSDQAPTAPPARAAVTAVYNRAPLQAGAFSLLPNGVHSGDEHYAGTSPSQGTELCAVVEGMFSIEHLLAILGDAALGDRLEKMSYNALPGTFDGRMSAHQYDQQPNQLLIDPHSLRVRQVAGHRIPAGLAGPVKALRIAWSAAGRSGTPAFPRA